MSRFEVSPRQLGYRDAIAMYEDRLAGVEVQYPPHSHDRREYEAGIEEAVQDLRAGLHENRSES